MKKAVLSFLALSILPASALADCQAFAERAALSFVKSSAGEQIGWEVGGSRLKRQSGSTLIYEVEMLPSYSDGASSYEFPAEIVLVRAAGNAARCRITGVKTK